MELIGGYVKGVALFILLGVVAVHGPAVLLFLFNEVL